ncbi:MAG: RidA family protein [Clostridiales bacterium]|nr:RidA family protein [Clostridiales bacterium]
MKEAISTNKAPGAIGPYSQAIKSGDTLYVSGQIPVNPETGEIKDTIEEQAKQSLENLKNILAANGMTTDNVVKTTVFITDLNDFAKVNEIYATFFNAPFPARSCIEISKIPKGCKIEIECIAVK